jgi:hypothetical protein
MVLLLHAAMPPRVGLALKARVMVAVKAVAMAAEAKSNVEIPVLTTEAMAKAVQPPEMVPARKAVVQTRPVAVKAVKNAAILMATNYRATLIL